MPRPTHLLGQLIQPIRATGRAATLVLKVFPMIPSRPVDWVTGMPIVEKVTYPTSSGTAQGEIYRPPQPGPHPGLVVCLGVVPFGVEHPQVPILGRALARAGFSALLYWSPAMRDFRLDPADIENIALAYDWFIDQPFVDPARSGLLGTCVGGAFALMASASPLIRDRVGFIFAYAPFCSMSTFAPDIASASRVGERGREPWAVDQLTRHVFIQSVTAWLEPAEAGYLRSVFLEKVAAPEPGSLSPGGQAVKALLTAQDADSAQAALKRLPASMQRSLSTLSPVGYVADIHAPLIVHLHDRGDLVIPVGESRRLHAAFAGRPGVHYTEMQFSHLDPSKGRLPLPRLLAEFGKFFLAIYPMFRQSLPT
jgi:dienelactone hydrolase